MEPTWEEEPATHERTIGEPISDRHSGVLGDLKLDRPTGFSLSDGGAVSYLAANANVVDAQLHEVAAAQLTVDGQVE